jgi:SAM-dependent methyltransferase
MAWSMLYIMPFTPYPYRGEASACDLCGTSESELICEFDRRLKRLRTVACRRCGLLRTDPMPTEHELEAYYRTAYRWDYQFARREPSRRHLTRCRREAQERWNLLAPVLQPGAHVLDFGSGAGVFLGLAKERGCNVLGIEPGEAYARFASNAFGVQVFCAGWERVDRAIGPFDVITIVEVLEHLRHPVAALRWIAERLAAGGVIYVTVPDVLSNGRETFRRFHFAHLYGFTPATLRLTVQVCGLELDPRFAQDGTRVVLRRAADPSPPDFSFDCTANLRDLYPPSSVSRYLLSGAWLTSRGRQLGKTLRDTFRP